MCTLITLAGPLLEVLMMSAHAATKVPSAEQLRRCWFSATVSLQHYKQQHCCLVVPLTPMGSSRVASDIAAAAAVVAG